VTGTGCPRKGFSGKKSAVLLWAAAFLVFTPGQSGSQEQQDGYYLEQTNEGLRFVQRLSWEPEEYASGYEVQAERQNPQGDWLPILSEFTENSFIEFSLPPGSYRYRVRAYDLMERPAGNSEWIFFEILPALSPALEAFMPDRLFLDKSASPRGEAAITITLKGRNLVEGAEFRLIPKKGDPVFPRQYIPEASGEQALLVFSGKLAPGLYTLEVVNPGGISDILESLRIYAPQTSRGFSLSAGYGPLIPLYGELHEMLEAPVFPAGAYGRIAFLPWGTDFANLGFETAFYWARIASPYKGEIKTYDVSGHSLGLKAYGLFQKPLNQNMALNLRLGGGLFSVLNFEKEASGEKAGSVNALVPAAGGGLSLQWFFSSSLFAELGADYTHFFSADNPSPGYIRPFAGIGFTQ
jgi:hypothetical protein